MINYNDTSEIFDEHFDKISLKNYAKYYLKKNIVQINNSVTSTYTMSNSSNATCDMCCSALKSRMKIYIFECYHFLCSDCFNNVNSIIKSRNLCPFCKNSISNNDFIASFGEHGRPPHYFFETKILEIMKNDIDKINVSDVDSDGSETIGSSYEMDYDDPLMQID